MAVGGLMEKINPHIIVFYTLAMLFVTWFILITFAHPFGYQKIFIESGYWPMPEHYHRHRDILFYWFWAIVVYFCKQYLQ